MFYDKILLDSAKLHMQLLPECLRSLSIIYTRYDVFNIPVSRRRLQ